MKDDNLQSEQSRNLRQEAEERLQKSKGEYLKPASEADLQKLVHELQVHQIELEMQNEELIKAKREAEELRNKYFDIYYLSPIGYITIDETGAVLIANLAIINLLGLDMMSALISRRFQLFIAQDYVTAFNDFCARTLRADAKQRCEVVLLNNGNPSIYAQLEGVSVESGELPRRKQIRVSVVDITERKKAEEEVRRLNAELEQKVRERTKELEAKIAEIQKMLKLFVDRELDMIKLKEKIKELETK